jgi:hypothetical protein
MAKAGTSVLVAEATVSRWIPLDPHLTPFAVTYQVGVSGSGSVTNDVNVEATLVDVIGGVTPATADIWELVSAKTATFNGSLANPVTAIRLNVTALVTAGTTRMTVLQAGN